MQMFDILFILSFASDIKSDLTWKKANITSPVLYGIYLFIHS